jgi:hypothetical protein
VTIAPEAGRRSCLSFGLGVTPSASQILRGTPAARGRSALRCGEP